MIQPLRATCPHCGRKYVVSDELIARYGGRETACVQCGNPVLIPATALDVMAGELAPAPVLDAELVDCEPAGAVPLSYQSPHRPSEEAGAVWRSGRNVAVKAGCAMPDRCVKCNRPSPAGRPVHVRVVWTQYENDDPLAKAVSAVLLGFYTVRARVFSAVVEIGLCPAHRAVRWLGILAPFASVLLSCLLFLDPVKQHLGRGIPALLSAALVYLGLVAYAFLGRPVEADSMTERVIVLTRAGRPFLESLPADPAGHRPETPDDVAENLRRMQG